MEFNITRYHFGDINSSLFVDISNFEREIADNYGTVQDEIFVTATILGYPSKTVVAQRSRYGVWTLCDELSGSNFNEDLHQRYFAKYIFGEETMLDKSAVRFPLMKICSDEENFAKSYELCDDDYVELTRVYVDIIDGDTGEVIASRSGRTGFWELNR